MYGWICSSWLQSICFPVPAGEIEITSNDYGCVSYGTTSLNSGFKVGNAFFIRDVVSVEGADIQSAVSSEFYFCQDYFTICVKFRDMFKTRKRTFNFEWDASFSRRAGVDRFGFVSSTSGLDAEMSGRVTIVLEQCETSQLLWVLQQHVFRPIFCFRDAAHLHALSPQVKQLPAANGPELKSEKVRRLHCWIAMNRWMFLTKSEERP